MKQAELIDKEGAQGKALGRDQTAGCHLLMGVEDTLELLIDVLHGERLTRPIAGIGPASLIGGAPACYRAPIISRAHPRQEGRLYLICVTNVSA
jgi:hypothetical protein